MMRGDRIVSKNYSPYQEYVGIIGGIKFMRTTIEVIIYAFFYSVLGCGVIVYVMTYFSEAEPPSFELAIISAVLGGFALTRGFLQRVTSDLRRYIRRVGVLYLGAAIFFTVLTLVIPMVKMDTTGAACWIVSMAYLISMLAAMLFFASATGLLIAKFPKLIQEFW